MNIVDLVLLDPCSVEQACVCVCVWCDVMWWRDVIEGYCTGKTSRSMLLHDLECFWYYASCVYLSLCSHVCWTWLIVPVPARYCACNCAFAPHSLSLYTSVFPWAFSLSLSGLVLLIRLCVWGHCCRVGLYRRDPETDRGQLLVLHSCERK